MHPPVDIRPAEHADSRAAGELRWDWVVHELGGTPVQDREVFVAHVVAWLTRHRDTHRGFVATVGGAIIGMAWVTLTPRFPSPRAPDRWSADLLAVYVRPDARGRGIGATLVHAVLDDAADRGAERAIVHSSDDAVPLYERTGFAHPHALMGRRLDRLPEPEGTAT